MKYKIYVTKPADREATITILARNGYTVREGKEKNHNNRTVYFVEYWEEKSDA